MGKINLLDCTLRDGGYINNWNFGEENIKGICRRLVQTGIEFIEIGFIKGKNYNPNMTIYPTIDSIKNILPPKNDKVKYIGMMDMNSPIPLSEIPPYDGKSIDGIRVIFKKEKMNEGYIYSKKIKELGYWLSVNFVGTDLYTDKEFIDGIEKFNNIKPDSMAIVDSFGLIKRRHFLRLIYIADNNMDSDIMLSYHAHNNLQQAFGNAEALVELNLKRDICIDACVFGMGRGAGNLNLELFAEYMNENYNTHYRLEPMLEIMDEYLDDIYKIKSWGYSLPLYLSANFHCHPNYAIYLSDRDTLNVKAFNEILKSIPDKDRAVFTSEKADKYYRNYQENYVDDKETILKLSDELLDKEVILLAPGKSLIQYRDKVMEQISSENTAVFSLNFIPNEFQINYVFSSNMRRFERFNFKEGIKYIITSNVKTEKYVDYIFNYASYAPSESIIIDNSGLMLIKILSNAGVKKIKIAGMDGYSFLGKNNNYYDMQLEFDFSKEATLRNSFISKELKEFNKIMDIEFITPTLYIL